MYLYQNFPNEDFDWIKTLLGKLKEYIDFLNDYIANKNINTKNQAQAEKNRISWDRTLSKLESIKSQITDFEDTITRVSRDLEYHQRQISKTISSVLESNWKDDLSWDQVHLNLDLHNLLKDHTLNQYFDAKTMFELISITHAYFEELYLEVGISLFEK